MPLSVELASYMCRQRSQGPLLAFARLLTDSSPQPHIVTLQPADTMMHAVGAAAALAAAAGEATAAAVEASSTSAAYRGVGPVKVGVAKCHI